MPSLAHDAILELFRRRPMLALELLRDLLHLPTPDLAHFRVGDTDLSEILPTERKADLVLLFAETPGASAARALVIEAQLAIDHDKRRSWWWYLVGIHTRHRCDAVLVVVTPSAAVAAWALQPIPLGHPGAWLTPIVIGPEQIPMIRDPAAALDAPELAVLSTLVHGQSDAGFDIARAALTGVRMLDDERLRGTPTAGEAAQLR